MPAVEVHLLPSQNRPTGVGECGVAPTAPAVANAIANATGHWLTRPVRDSGMMDDLSHSAARSRMPDDGHGTSLAGAAIGLDLLFPALLNADLDQVAALFPTVPALDTPLNGAIDEHRALKRYVRNTAAWLRQNRAELRPGVTFGDGGLDELHELVLDLDRGGIRTELPVVLVGQRTPGGFGQVRMYHSTWPLNGSHTVRSPIPCSAPHSKNR